MLRIGVMVSGGGTNLQAIIDSISEGKLPNCKIVTVVSSKEGVFALERAKKHSIPYAVISKKAFKTQEEYDISLLEHMRAYEVDLVVLAGFLSLLGRRFVEAYKNAIINVHPSLIPAFCGKGNYGLIPHIKALEYGVKITGATVHFVDCEYDSGPIILRRLLKLRMMIPPKPFREELWKRQNGYSFLKLYAFSVRAD